MKVVDFRESQAPESGFGKTLNQFQDAVSSALGGKSALEAQELVIRAFEKTLPNRYTMLRNLPLERAEGTIPLVLVGPNGIYVINVNAEKGVYRAKGEILSEMNRSQEFLPVRPNPITRTLTMAQAIDDCLQEREIDIPEIQPVLFFSNAGTHVDSSRPAVKIVLFDGLERLVSAILQSEVVLSAEETSQIVEALKEIANPVVEEEPVQKGPGLGSKIEPRLTEGIGSVSTRLGLSTRQWVLLGVMAFVEILILIGFILLIVSTTS